MKEAQMKDYNLMSHHAESLLSNPLLAQIFDDMANQYYTEMDKAFFSDDKKRLECQMRVLAIKDVKNILIKTLERAKEKEKQEFEFDDIKPID